MNFVWIWREKSHPSLLRCLSTSCLTVAGWLAQGLVSNDALSPNQTPRHGRRWHPTWNERQPCQCRLPICPSAPLDWLYIFNTQCPRQNCTAFITLWKYIIHESCNQLQRPKVRPCSSASEMHWYRDFSSKAVLYFMGKLVQYCCNNDLNINTIRAVITMDITLFQRLPSTHTLSH